MRTIEEKNRMIAEFMGVNKNNNGTYELPQFGRLNLGGEFKTEFNDTQLKYHLSWEWLMPVVEEIEENDRFDVEILQFGTIIKDNQVEIVNNVADISFNKKIDHTYNAVVEFIEWYNENK
jgi:hypothetical protein